MLREIIMSDMLYYILISLISFSVGMLTNMLIQHIKFKRWKKRDYITEVFKSIRDKSNEDNT